MDENDILEKYGMINRSQQYTPLTIEQRIAILEARIGRALTIRDRQGSINGDGVWNSLDHTVGAGLVWDLLKEKIKRKSKKKEEVKTNSTETNSMIWTST